MKIKKLNLLWFSATNSTKKIVNLIANELDIEKRKEYDITNKRLPDEINLNSDNLLLIGMPVYAGRIPRVTLSCLQKMKGNNTPAILVCVYGNRDYEDALLELKTIVSRNGFNVIAAGAFIAQHSIFPQIGSSRPDIQDEKIISKFAQESKNILSSITKATISKEDILLRGNIPFKATSQKIPFRPKTKESKCNKCRLCYAVCPVSAISYRNPAKVEDSCISCGRCIVSCPQKARHFGGLLYYFVEKKFNKTHCLRKEPEMFFLKPN